MKINVLAENLKKGLSIAMRGVSTRVQLPILSTILLKASKEGLVLSATDLELSFRVKVRAKVGEEGEIAVPAKLFADLVATLPVGAVDLSDKKQITLAATDGYRLGVDYFKNDVPETLGDSQKFVLPVRALMELVRVLEPAMKTVKVEFDNDKQQVIFLADDIEMSSSLIAGEFPPYTKVIPTEKKITVVIDKEALLEAVKRASLFARDSANVVKLAVTGEGGAVTAQSDQMGGSQTTIEAEVEGDEVTIAFNARYLLDYLGVVREDKITLETEGELKPAVFRIEKSDFLHVIMPVRTQN